MGIFSRFNRVLKSNLNSLMDNAEDPAKLIDQTIVEMENELKNAKKELVQTLGAAKRLDKKKAELEEEVAEWEDKAVLALKSGDEELAREALKMKQKVTRQADEAKRQAAEQEKAAFQMKDTLEEIEQKIEDLKARKSTLASKVRAARSGPDELGTSGRGGAIGDLERLSGRIDSLEAEVEAHDVLDDAETRDIEARFRDLERKAGRDHVDDELEALKRRLEE
ncbi:MAG TPA: PspA/IM30 family protein [Sandaracinaceae bacterium LLY-WYZ-13_1]|nr:PspA/IM30 family protein [Sandaracinaceae bacterium LLY-WYZ-13_1]